MSLLVGIAGRTGAGKNYIAGILEELGWRTLDLDLVGHRALESLADEIEERLGPGLRGSDGSIDRRKLGALVFGDPEKLAVLEEVAYPWIENETRKWTAEEPGKPSAIHAVNLHKTRLVEELDAVIWVHAPARIRLRRVMERDSRPRADLEGRFRAQKGLNSKIFPPNAEIYSVRNSGDRSRVKRRLNRILRRL